MADASTVSDWSKLGGIVRDARLSAGLTQAALATRAGVSRSWLARVEAGHRGVELEQLIRLLGALGLTLAVTAEDPPPAGTRTSETSTDVDGTRTRRVSERRAAWASLPLPGSERLR